MIRCWTCTWVCCSVAVLLVGVSLSRARPPSPPVDADPPVAPKLTGEPIQYLDRLYQDAFVDQSGRAWLLVRKIALGTTARKKAFEHLVCPDLPGKVLEFPALNIPIGFDAKGRFWEVTRYGLGCTEVATGDFTEREVAPGISPDRLAKPDPTQGQFQPGFSRVMLEHSSGRLYFVDSYGLHVLDGGTWSYQLFGPAPKGLGRRGYPARLIECPDGAVLTGGSRGLWTHDGKSWRRHSAKPYEVAPLADGQCLVMASVQRMGRIGRLRLKDDTPTKADGREALTTRWSNFKHVLAVPRGASLVQAYDRARRSTLLAMITPAGEVHELPPEARLRREHQIVPRSVVGLPDGRVVLPTRPLYTWDGRRVSPLFANPLAVSGRYLGADKLGRVFLNVDDQEIGSGCSRIAVVSPRFLTVPPSLPVEMFGHVESAVLNINGQVWAKFRDRAFLSRYDAGQWRHVAPPEGMTEKRKYAPYRPMLLQPLARGCLLAAIPGRGACFFDGRQWTGHASLRSLVEVHTARLRKVIDNRRAGDAGSALTGLDAGGRIWVMHVLEPGTYRSRGASVYDGRQWLDLGGLFLMGPDGTVCIRQTRGGAAVYDASVWPPKELSSLPQETDKPCVSAGVHFDHAKRFIAQKQFDGPAWRWDGADWAKLPVRGRCVLADSAGRMWFNGGFSLLTLVDADGRIGPSYKHPMNNKGQVVEQAPGVYWCAASDGLMQLGVADRGGKPVIVVRKHYGDLVPQGKVRQLFFDRDDGLWVVTDRLVRIKMRPHQRRMGGNRRCEARASWRSFWR